MNKMRLSSGDVIEYKTDPYLPEGAVYWWRHGVVIVWDPERGLIQLEEKGDGWAATPLACYSDVGPEILSS